jgi:hypothetical protein
MADRIRDAYKGKGGDATTKSKSSSPSQAQRPDSLANAESEDCSLEELAAVFACGTV